MPRLAAWIVRAALLYWLLGMTLGALLLWQKAVPGNPWLWATLPAHIEFLLVGWLGQVALGVAYWILPRFAGGARGPVWPVATAWALLNLGIWLTALAGTHAGLLAAGRLAEVAALLLFGAHGWRRVQAAAR
jgi:hypothetical protein